MTILTDDVKKDLVEPENINWTMISAVAGDDLRYGVQMLVDRLKDDGNQLTVYQIIEILSSLLKEHKESMDTVVPTSQL